MATIKRFEDLELWQMAAKLDVEVFKMVSENARISKDFRLRDQILGSSGSIMDNIAEGFERQGNRVYSVSLHFQRFSRRITFPEPSLFKSGTYF